MPVPETHYNESKVQDSQLPNFDQQILDMIKPFQVHDLIFRTPIVIWQDMDKQTMADIFFVKIYLLTQLPF